MFSEVLDELLEVLGRMRSLGGKIDEAVDVIYRSVTSGGKVLVFGNGGSAADADHFACELVNKLKVYRTPIPAVSLTSNGAVITSIANDMGYEGVFSRQIEALGRPGDVAFGISTSGMSKNVVKALETAKGMGLYAIGLVGLGGGDVSRVVDLLIEVPSSNTQRVQEAHVLIYHYIAECLERRFLEKKG